MNIPKHELDMYVRTQAAAQAELVSKGRMKPHIAARRAAEHAVEAVKQLRIFVQSYRNNGGSK